MIVLTKIHYLEPSLKSNESDPSVWSARKPKQLLVFSDLITGERTIVTDLQKAKYRRECVLRDFLCSYWELYISGKITMVSAVIDADEYKDTSMVIRGLKKRLKSRKSDLIQYVCCRDKGDLCQRNHFHILFAARNLNPELVKALYTSKHSSAQLLLTKYGMAFYLNKKELISSFRKKAFTSSRAFKLKKLSTANNATESQVGAYNSNEEKTAHTEIVI
jgi:hypothetical protein